MKNGTAIHPGAYLKRTYMEPLKISNQKLSVALSVSSASVSRLVAGKSSVSVEMAIKLSKAFGNSAAQWLNLQSEFDVDNACVDVKSISKIEK